MENPTPQTFDIAEMFAGVSFPKETVEVFVNPGVAYEYSKLTTDSLAAMKSGDPDQLAEIEERQKALIETAGKFRFEIHLQGVMQDVLDAAYKKAQKEFPPAKSAPQIPGLPAQVEYSDEFYEYLNVLTWQILITKIVAPDGREVTSPDETFISQLRSKLPLSEKARVEDMIRKFNSDAKAGFEAIVQERDFLSKASSEA